MVEIDKQYIGQRLLERGFREWMLYMFRIVDGTPFIVESLHNELFKQIQAVIDGTDTRININLCPRTGKTTIASYLCAFAMALNPKSQIIYTSFNQELLTQIASRVAGILQHPVYQAMYGSVKPTTETTESDPIDEFWADYLLQTTGQAKYSSRKIVTAQGGIILFNSIGGAITGFGCGIRNAKGFSGFLILDDADKVNNIHSQKIREKTHNYYSDTLLTRLNNPDTPIINMQQRLHIDDMTAYLERVYGFKTFKFPLLNADGTCNLPHQYPPERVNELQKNSATFSAQYQQQPVKIGGNLIKTEWFKRYNVPPAKMDSMFIVADTAFSEKKSSDNSAFLLCGLLGKDLYILDGYCKKVIFPELCRGLVSFHQSAIRNYPTTPFTTIYIENKGSGISLIQQLRQQGLPISELMPTVHNPQLRKDQVADKYTRFLEVSADLESGYCHIPESAPWLLEFITECEAFTGGNTDVHDDYCFVAGTKIKTLFGDKPIERVKVGDLLITPFGVRRVMATKSRIKDVIYNADVGLCGTPEHKVLSFRNGMIPLCKAQRKDCMLWNMRNLHIWKTKKALFSTELNTAEWVERDYISYLMQHATKTGKTRKDCMSRYGNISTVKRCQQVISCITKTVIHLTATLTIWSVYHTMNTCRNIWQTVKRFHGDQNKLNALKAYENLHLNGTNRQQVVNGTKSTPKKSWKIVKKSVFAWIAGLNLCHTKTPDIKQMRLTGGGVKDVIEDIGTGCIENYSVAKSRVYNLTVNGGLYFANDVLVSNCDTLIYALKQRRKGTITDWTALNKAILGF